MPDDAEKIGAGEFGRFRLDFQAFQARLSTDLNAIQDRLERRMQDGFGTVIEKQDQTNGQVATHTQELIRVDGAVTTVRDKLCEHLDAHEKSGTDPGGAGFVWKPKHTAAAGGAMAVMAGAVEVIRSVVAHLWK
jgi:hypothetical protein